MPVEGIRDASRRMVRELGFLKPTLAGTALSASAVHAIVEIGRGHSMDAKALGVLLLLARAKKPKRREKEQGGDDAS